MFSFNFRFVWVFAVFSVISLNIFGSDATTDKKSSDKKSTNNVKVDKKDSKQKSDPMRLKKEKIDKVKSDMKKNLDKITSSKKKIAEFDKQILKLNQDLVKLIDTKKLEATQNKKNDILTKKLELEKEVKEINFTYKKLEEHLVSISDNFEIADGTLNWNKSWDISDRTKYRDGKWSITVKAINENGNESKEEGINIKVNPKSDIPVLNVINPVNNARVPGNLKIVGTAIDDDGIDKVLVWVNAEKQPRVCEGKDFWYYDLDTSEMKDGVHTLRFKAYDITYDDAKKITTSKTYLLKESKEYSVKFRLDRKTPVVDIKTMKSGAIVSGVMNIGGDAYDDNTIVGMEYSLDDRVSFNDIPILKYLNNTKTKVSWNIRVDSENLVDGIQTIWIKAKDGTGSVGYSPLTVTVDHKKPTIRLDFPTDKSAVDGTFNAYGYVKDNVDVKNISFAIEGSGADGKFKEVKLLPGNPYWSYFVNLSKLKDGKYKLIAKVEDVAGNIETSSVTVTLESERDKPVLNLKSFKKDERFSTSMQIFGDLSDDDGNKDISIKIFKDGVNNPVYSEKIGAKFYFSKEINLTDKAKFLEGKYVLELIPTDVYGVSGKAVKESFIIDREVPDFEEKTLEIWAGKYFGGKLNMPVKVVDYGGLKSLFYTITDPVSKNVIVNRKELKFKESKPGIYDSDSISDDISKFVPDTKVVAIKLEATDFINNVARLDVPIIVDSKSPTIKDIIMDQKAGLTKDQSVDIGDNFALKELTILFTTPLKKDPEKTVLNFEKLKEGFSKEFNLRVKSADGKSILSYALDITAKDMAGNETKKNFKINFKDTKAASHKIRINIEPTVTLNINEGNSVLLEDTTFGIDNISSRVYCLLNKETESIKFKYKTEVEEIVVNTDKKGRKTQTKVKKSVENDVFQTLVNAESGISVIKFLKDERGNIPLGNSEGVFFTVNREQIETEFGKVNFVNDMSIPESTILWPPSFVNFNDSVFVYGIASDDNENFTLQYSFDSENAYEDAVFMNLNDIKNINVPDIEPLRRGETISLSKFIQDNSVDIKEGSKLFKIEAPLKDKKDGEHYILFRIRDAVGKEIIKKSVVYYDSKAPKIKLWTPKDKEIVNGEITLRGEANDDKYISNVVVMHNGKEQVADGSKMWETIYNLNNLVGVDKSQSLNLHSIEIFAIDAAGNKQFLKNDVRIDTTSDAPVVYVNNPSVPDQRFTDIIEIGGVALDDDGVEYVQFRIDGELAGLNEDSTIGEWERIEMVKGNPNWNKKIPKDYLEPGRHLLEVQAVDMYGLKGKIVSIPFHLDLENPQIRILSPSNGTYLEGEKIISGKASDPNEIDYVEISTNYGWTFVRAEGQENWKYYFDSRSVPDGALRVLIRAKDKAGSEAFSFALYNIDNKKPELEVLMPKDKMKINNKFRIIGRAKDNIALESVKLNINCPNWKFIAAPKKIDYIRFDKEISPFLESEDQERFLKNNYVLDNETGFYILKENVNNETRAKIYDILYSVRFIDGFIDAEGDSKEAWYYDINTTDWILDKTNKFQVFVAVRDMAGNITEQTINFEVSPVSDLPTVELDQPQPGQHMTGDTLDFNGTVYDDDEVDSVYIKIDNRERVKAVINGNSWSYALPTVDLENGLHKITIVAFDKKEDGSQGNSSGLITRVFYYDDAGPVIDITSHINGKPMGHRPWLSGTSSYYEKDLDLKLKKQIQLKKYLELKKKYRRTPEKIPQMETIEVKTYEVDFLKWQYLFDNRIKDINLSIDNGKTYEKNIGVTANWQTRVQTQFLRDGYHMLQIKATTYSGKESIRYFRTLIDRNIPEVIIDHPVENQALNEKIYVRGSANDKGKIEQVKIVLRPHDKDLGKIPKFIQGIYLWTQMFSGPWISAGFGLSFFDDIVRLEGLYGWTPTRSNIEQMGFNKDDIPEIFRQNYGMKRYQPRFSGFTAGGKLLARVIDIPFEFFFGEDAKNFSWSVEIGCGFYWFSGYGGVEAETNNSYYQLEKGRDYDPLKDGKLLAGFMYQFDFFKVERWGIFRKFAIYFENSFYFITSEIEGGLYPQVGFGIRNAFF